jgi:hypothetical protein
MRLPTFDPESLSAPIPGMSLTTEPGNRPWENPPQLTTLEEAVGFYTEKLLDPEKEDAILNAFAEEISIESMADMITTSAVMDGIHTIDVSILVSPVIHEMLKYVADINDVDYIESYADIEKKKRIPVSEARKIVDEVVKEMGREAVPNFPELGAPEKEEEEMPKPRSAGLMARKPRMEE